MNLIDLSPLEGPGGILALTRKGKIGSLPLDVRTELNRRLDDGEQAAQILPWLNADERARPVLERDWPGQPVSAQNLSDWRQGGYAEWRRWRGEIEKTRELIAQVTESGETATSASVASRLADGGAVIAMGRVLAELPDAPGDKALKALQAIGQVRHHEDEKAKMELRRQRIAHQAELMELRRQRIAQQAEMVEITRRRDRHNMAATFLKWYKDKRAQDIIDSRDGNAERIEKIGKLMFGEDW